MLGSGGNLCPLDDQTGCSPSFRALGKNALASELHVQESELRFWCKPFQAEAPTQTECLVSLTFQSLSVSTSSLAVAENMADLIDGYCRLEGSSESSLIIRPNKGIPRLHQPVISYFSTVCTLLLFQPGIYFCTLVHN